MMQSHFVAIGERNCGGGKPRCLRAVRTRSFQYVCIKSSLDRGMEWCNAASVKSCAVVEAMIRKSFAKPGLPKEAVTVCWIFKARRKDRKTA